MTLLRLVSLLILLGFAHNASAQTCSANACLGVAKGASNSGRQVSYDIVLENFGAQTLTTFSAPEDLDAAFGAGNYTIFSPPVVSAGVSTLLLNGGFDGSADTQLISGGSLAPGAQVTLSFGVEITNIVDLGSGLGVYSNQVLASADGNGETTDDLSDDGNNPDPGGNDDPTDAGENDPTVIDILANPIVGAAKNAVVMGTEVTFTATLENFGNVNLTSLSAVDDLDTVFGSGNYAITAGPTIVDDPGTVTLNAGFDGSAQNDLLDPSSSLAIGDIVSVEFVVDITNPSDVGMGVGVYENQITTMAMASGKPTTDLSTEGLDPDPDGNSTPSENRPTAVVLGEEPQIGLAKSVSVNNSVITVDLYVENLGNVTLSSLSLTDDLNAALGSGNYFVSTAPSFVDNPGSMTLNSAYDGNMDTELISAGDLGAGDTAQIQFDVTVLTLADVGAGLGVYENQASIEGFAAGGGFTTDLSDDGTDPDPNGNGDPTEAGEGDSSPFTVAPVASLGISKEYISGGSSGGFPVVNLQFTVTNYGNQTVDNISITDDLNAVYGAGNFQHIQDPAFVSGTDALSYNSAFNGNSNTTMVTNGSLDPTESVTFRIQHWVTASTDQGFGEGIYQNQVTVIGTDPSVNPVSDVSHEGSDPDPNSDGSPDEMDPTVIDTTVIGVIGAAKDVSVTGNAVTVDLYLENLGDLEVQQVASIENLDDIFGVDNYTLSSPPTLTDDPGSITLNASFDGSTQTDLFDISAGSALVAGDTATIRYVVDVDNVVNQGLGLGNYSTQSTLSAFDVNGAATQDDSDDGTDPDPNGNDNPSEGGENDATTFAIVIDSPIGVANEALVSGFNVTLNLYLENLGSGTLSDVSLINSLDDTLGAGNYTITALPMLVDDPGTLTLNVNYDGSEDTQIVASGSTLGAGATAQIQLTVSVDTESDQGNGFGIYSSQTTARGTQPNGVVVSDFSDDGTDPDPNGNSDPGETGEDDPTSIVIAGNPAVGIALQATVNGAAVTYDFYIENLGDVTLTNVIVENPLNPVFGGSNYSVTNQPSLVSGPDTLARNTNFFGFSVFDIVIGGGFLRPGETEQIRLTTNITNVTDQGNGFGVYNNSVIIDATGPDGSPVTDTSDSGTDPDPNGNSNANEAGENDLTQVTIGDEAVLGVAKQATTVGQQVTFDIYLDNLRASTLSSLSLTENLDDVFGAGNYSINGSPSLVDDPGTITLNGSFDGSTNTQLLDGASTLGGSGTAQIQLVVDVTNVIDLGNGLGNYRNQVEASGTAPLGTFFSDLSDAGTDPDPDGNGLPNDSDENDPTTFSVGTVQVGAAKNATVDGRQVTLDYAIENLGSTTFTNVSLPDDLDAVFGAGNYTIVSGPTLTSSPRDLVVNTAFNGSSDTELVASGGIGLGVTEQIQLVVEVSSLIDGGSGLGTYSNQVTVTADSASDLSDAGTNPDPNGNGDATEAGENDATVFIIAQDAVVGVAKTASVTGRTVTMDLYLEGLGNVDANIVSLVEDLDATFGAGNFAVSSAATLIDDPGTLTLNGSFDGSAQNDLLTGASTLAQGATAQIRFSINVGTVTDQGLGLGLYQNQAQSTATAPDASTRSDLSDAGTNPDSNGDGLPNSVGEDTPTDIVLQANIGDFVWNDLNGDGVQDTGEPGLEGVTVFIDANASGTPDGGEAQDVTDSDGEYGLFNLDAGTYQVNVDATTLPSGFVLTGGTAPIDVSVFAGEDARGVDFGYQQQDATIGDRVFNDLGGNGVDDQGDPGLSGVTVFIDANSNGVLDGSEAFTTTDGNGAYDLTALPLGSYTVTVDATTVPTGFVLTTNDASIAVSLTAGEDFNDADFGYQQANAQIGDLIWDDLNANGVFDNAEPGLNGVLVFADLNLNGIADSGEPMDVTVSGGYALTDLVADTYLITVDPDTLPVEYASTTGNVPLSVDLAAGENFDTADFGFSDQVGASGQLRLQKRYPVDPVQQGRTVILTYLITNTNATTATQLGFSDDLGASLPGLSSVGLPLFDVCGTGSTVSGTDLITLSAGTLSAGQSCSIEVPIQVPVSATPSDYLSTTGALTSAEFIGNVATATLTVLVNSLDVSVSITNNLDEVTDQDVTDYLVTVVNEDSVSSVEDVVVNLPLPAAVSSATWDCQPSTGALCSASGTGAINDFASLPVGGSVVYTWSASLPDVTDPSLDVTVTVNAPTGLTDVALGDNTDSDLDPVIEQIVFRSSFEEGEGNVNKLGSGKARVPAAKLSALRQMPIDLLIVKDALGRSVYRVQGRRLADERLEYRFLWFIQGEWSIGGWQNLATGEDLELHWNPDGAAAIR
ncbi:MAG: SdrD B-like domain-containing protein [Lysobacterales bacterium]